MQPEARFGNAPDAFFMWPVWFSPGYSRSHFVHDPALHPSLHLPMREVGVLRDRSQGISRVDRVEDGALKIALRLLRSLGESREFVEVAWTDCPRVPVRRSVTMRYNAAIGSTRRAMGVPGPRVQWVGLRRQRNRLFWTPECYRRRLLVVTRLSVRPSRSMKMSHSAQ